MDRFNAQDGLEGRGQTSDRTTEVCKGWPFGADEAVRRQTEAAIALDAPKEMSLDLGKGVLMKLVLIPPGDFLMGTPRDEPVYHDEEQQHKVTITKPFYLGRHKVTQKQYEQVMGNSPSYFKKATEPVDSISWNDATEFCKKLSASSGKRVRLPTEAEWEYACRAGTASVYESDPHAFGLVEMSLGELGQWCADWYDADYYALSPQVDPQGPSTGKCHVVRGTGSVLPVMGWRARMADREQLAYDPEFLSLVSFRIVCEVDSK